MLVGWKVITSLWKPRACTKDSCPERQGLCGLRGGCAVAQTKSVCLRPRGLPELRVSQLFPLMVSARSGEGKGKEDGRKQRVKVGTLMLLRGAREKEHEPSECEKMKEEWSGTNDAALQYGEKESREGNMGTVVASWAACVDLFAHCVF